MGFNSAFKGLSVYCKLIKNVYQIICHNTHVEKKDNITKASWKKKIVTLIWQASRLIIWKTSWGPQSVIGSLLPPVLVSWTAFPLATCIPVLTRDAVSSRTFVMNCHIMRHNIWEDYCIVHPTRCNVTQFIFLQTALHVSGGTTTHHQERKQLYLQLPLFVIPLLLSWKSWNRFECAVGGVRTLKPVPTLPR